MKLTVNGEERALDRPVVAISELLALSGVEMPDTVSVQHNGQFVDRKDYAATIVAEGDEVDFVYFMGGGCR